MSGHDAQDGWTPFDDEHTGAQIDGVCAISGPPPRRVLDLACGDGRVLIPLLERGYDAAGLDRDPAALHACRARGVDEQRLARTDFLNEPVEDSIRHVADAAICLGNTLMTLTAGRDLRRAFAFAFAIVRAGGVFIIDDFPFQYWRELAEGNWQEGISEDGCMQLIWMPGEAVFSIRTGSAVDPGQWELGPDDALHRLWSWSELKDAAGEAGFSGGEHHAENHLIAFRRVD